MKTAIDWLVEESKKFHNKQTSDEMIAIAKKKFESQIKKAFEDGLLAALNDYPENLSSKYFKQTYD